MDLTDRLHGVLTARGVADPDRSLAAALAAAALDRRSADPLPARRHVDGLAPLEAVPVDEAPVNVRGLVYLNDVSLRGWTFGKVADYGHGGAPLAVAEGYNGSWTITHFCRLPSGPGADGAVPIAEAPHDVRGLVYIDEQPMRGWAIGRVHDFRTGTGPHPVAEGYNGDWNITHFCPFPPAPKP